MFVALNVVRLIALANIAQWHAYVSRLLFSSRLVGRII